VILAGPFTDELDVITLSTVSITTRTGSEPFFTWFCRRERVSFVENPQWARGDLNPHILSDTGT
jgi:hypothetical protein